MGLGMRELIVILLTAVITLGLLWPYGRIFYRVGYSPWLSLLMLVPLVNVVTIWLFAYAQWPAVTAKSSAH
jgi:hypothetical protein